MSGMYVCLSACFHRQPINTCGRVYSTIYTYTCSYHGNMAIVAIQACMVFFICDSVSSRRKDVVS